MVTDERSGPPEKVPAPSAASTPDVARAESAEPFTEKLGRDLRYIGNWIILVGVVVGPLAVRTAGWVWTRPRALDQKLRSVAGDGNDLLYRFLQALILTALTVCGILIFLSSTFWLWYSAPFWMLAVGVALLIAGGKKVERSRAIGGGIATLGFAAILLGLPFAALRVSSRAAQQREERETRQANEQVAALVESAQADFDRGDLDRAEGELGQAAMTSKATDKHAAELLQGKIRVARQVAQQAAVREANRLVSDLVADAVDALRNGDIESAESNLAKASAVAGATNKAEADEVRRKLPAAIAAKRQKEANEEVAKLVSDATVSFEAGQYEKALQAVNKALTTKYATDLRGVEELVAKIGSARPDLLLRDGLQAIEQRHFPAAARLLKGHLANSKSEKRPEAAKLLESLEIVLDEAKAREFLRDLKSMSYWGQYAGLLERDELPDSLTTGSPTLTSAVKSALNTQLSQQERSQFKAQQQEQEAKAREAIAMWSAKSEQANESEFGKTADAWLAATIIVKERLKSPSTASFGWQTSESCVAALGGGKYRVKGWVDAQNAFGATVRTDFSMDMHADDKGNWHAEDITMEQR
jgi:hypothetical protein